MSISHSLSNALSGMTAASRMAEVVSSNVANAMTDGYGRRSLELSSAVLGDRGAGVEIRGTQRHVNRSLISERRFAASDHAFGQARLDLMNRVQDIVGRPGASDSVASRIAAVEQSLIAATNDPSSQMRLTTLGDKFKGLAGKLNTASFAIQEKRQEADGAIAHQVKELNTGLKQVDAYNKDIVQIRASGGDPTGLFDKRQQLVDRISAIVPLREMEREGGKIALMTYDGAILVDSSVRQFEFTPSPVITAEMSLAGGPLSGLVLDGQSVGADGIGRFGGGTLGAAFQARDEDLVAVQSGLDDLAADLIKRFQSTSVDPTLNPGDAGLLTDGGSAFDPANLTGLAGRISLNAAVDPEQGGNVTRFRDGMNALHVGPAGETSHLTALSKALSISVSSERDPSLRSAAGRAANLMSDIGLDRVAVEEKVSFANARLISLKDSEAANGVDTDFEMQMLLRIEQAYAANARVIQTIDSMMHRLMEI